MGMTSLREAIAAQLASSLNIMFVSKQLQGPSTERDIGCTWPIRTSEMEDNVDLQEHEIGISVWLRLKTQQAEAEPVDVGPIEELAERIQEALDDIQVGAGGTWYFRVVSLEYDVELQGVTATVISVDWNAFSQVLDGV